MALSDIVRKFLGVLNSPVIKDLGKIVALIITTAGITSAICDKFFIEPKKEKIADLSQQLKEVKRTNQPPPGIGRESIQLVEPPAVLPYKISRTTDVASQAPWLEALRQKLETEGQAEKDVRIVLVKFDPFKDPYRRFRLQIKAEWPETKLSGSYSFHVRGTYYSYLPLNVKTGELVVPESATADSLVLLVRLRTDNVNTVPSGVELEKLLSAKPLL